MNPTRHIAVLVGSLRAASINRRREAENVLACLDVPTLGQPEAYIQFKPGFVSEAGESADADSRAFLQTWLDTDLASVERHLAPARAGAGR